MRASRYYGTYSSPAPTTSHSHSIPPHEKVELERCDYDNLSPGGERVRVGTLRKLSGGLRAAAALLWPFKN